MNVTLISTTRLNWSINLLSNDITTNGIVRADETKIAQTGVPALLVRAKNFGNKPSFAADCAILPTTIVQPFNDPMHIIIAAMEIAIAQDSPPNIIDAASA